MQTLEREIARISTLLPQLETDVIRDFMANIPKEIAYLRIPLTLTHFYKLEDNQNALKLKEENLQHARLIHDLFPIYSVEKILKKLKKYGNIPERCRLVIRNILKGKEEEMKTALLNVHQTFKINLKKQGTSTRHNNDDETVQFVNDSSKYILMAESHKGDCDIPESTSPKDEPRRSQESFETIITSPVYPELIADAEDSDVFQDSNVQEAKLDDSSFMWEDETPNLHPAESSDAVQLSQINRWDNNSSISPEVVSSTESEIKKRERKPDDIASGRQQIEQVRIETSPESSGNLPSSVVIWPTGSEVDSKDSLNVNETAKFLSKLADQPLETSSEQVPPEASSSEPARKKLKTENLEGIEASGKFDLIETLAEITSKSRRSIADHCLKYGIDVYRKPSQNQMDKLINALLVDVPDASSDEFFSEDDLDNSDVIFLADTNPVKRKEANMERADDLREAVQSATTYPSLVDDGSAAQSAVSRVNNNVVFRAMEIFPDADPNYIRKLYGELPDQAGAEGVLSEALIERMLEVENYPKRPAREPIPEEDVDIEEQVAFVSELLPDADPSFLRIKVSELTTDELKDFVADALEQKNYPTLKEYLRKQQLSAQMRQYSVEFSVENFVKLVPDPISTFEDPKRNVIMDKDDILYVHQFFKNIFSRVSVKTISNEWLKSQNRPYVCYKALQAVKTTMKSTRQKVELKTLMCKNIPLLQELAFIEHAKEILSHIEQLKIRKEEDRLSAKNAGLMLTCNCCFDDEIMPDDSHTCGNNCVFCRQCIVKGVEVAFGEGKLVFPCLGDCGSSFNLTTLQNVLPPNLFSKVAQKQALAEVKAAGMEDLEFCPFCDFATIPPGAPETDKIFVCQNPDCLKESCRLCREPSHVPLRCDEVEKDEDVKKRVYIENKMTEALLRKCWKCGISFYKEEGCNKMTCSCGAHMCYICGKPVTDYKHFNGIGGDRHDLCPLYSDTNAINQENVLKGAEVAKEEIGVAGGSTLKHDPTSDVKKHFEERAKKLPMEAHMQHLQRLNQMAAAVRFPNQLGDGPMRMHDVLQHWANREEMPRNALVFQQPMVVMNAVRMPAGLPPPAHAHAHRVRQRRAHQHNRPPRAHMNQDDNNHGLCGCRNCRRLQRHPH